MTTVARLPRSVVDPKAGGGSHRVPNPPTPVPPTPPDEPSTPPSPDDDTAGLALGDLLGLPVRTNEGDGSVVALILNPTMSCLVGIEVAIDGGHCFVPWTFVNLVDDHRSMALEQAGYAEGLARILEHGARIREIVGPFRDATVGPDGAVRNPGLATMLASKWCA